MKERCKWFFSSFLCFSENTVLSLVWIHPPELFILSFIPFVLSFISLASFGDPRLKISPFTFPFAYSSPWREDKRVANSAAASGFNISAGWSRDSCDWLSKFSRDEKWKYTAGCWVVREAYACGISRSDSESIERRARLCCSQCYSRVKAFPRVVHTIRRATPSVRKWNRNWIWSKKKRKEKYLLRCFLQQFRRNLCHRC